MRTEKSNEAMEGGFSKASVRIALPCDSGFLSTSDLSSCCLQAFDFANTFLASLIIALQSEASYRSHLFMCSHF